MNPNMTKEEIENIEKVINDLSYESLDRPTKLKLIYKVDNFLEALYLAPTLFDYNVIRILKYRENKLSEWRHVGHILGGFTYLSIYAIYKKKTMGAFYFRNFWFLLFSTSLVSYISGRSFEYMGNKLLYEKILFSLAAKYNVTDEEIEELQFKINEDILKENQEKQNQGKNSLDSVKFRM